MNADGMGGHILIITPYMIRLATLLFLIWKFPYG